MTGCVITLDVTWEDILWQTLPCCGLTSTYKIDKVVNYVFLRNCLKGFWEIFMIIIIYFSSSSSSSSSYYYYYYYYYLLPLLLKSAFLLINKVGEFFNAYIIIF